MPSLLFFVIIKYVGESMKFIDFDGTITSKDSVYTNFILFQIKRLLTKPNKTIVKLMKKYPYVILTNSMNIEKFFIYFYLLVHRLPIKNCKDVVCISRYEYTTDKELIYKRKAEIIFNHFIDLCRLSRSIVDVKVFDHLYVDNDDEVRNGVIEQCRLIHDRFVFNLIHKENA